MSLSYLEERFAAWVLCSRRRGLTGPQAEDQVLAWREWPFDLLDQYPRLSKALSTCSFTLFGLATKLLYQTLCRSVAVTGREHMTHFRERPQGKGLITVSNHLSNLDDPGMWGFLPIGVYQRGVDYAIELVNRGRWVHIFPEGKIFQDNLPRRIKWGVGRILLEAEPTPLLMSIHISGFERLRPLRQRWPSPGQDLKINLGPIHDLREEVLRARELPNPEQARKYLTDVVQNIMHQHQAQHTMPPPTAPSILTPTAAA
ncbi:uncharacterized protein MONBRDRAFT_33822 [Monosiga brevicollis MX1]|uniref:Tafazzin family protein n=1 Tax=Monosiga brevicollis TaxID=81824 RepID=A9V7R4_MONBE|nr:uncharacterized protein MONBRDRAFT_33822 [Monosiga brevicollis MX1]EDQ86352.1 predicted protein [Monosiga brevicollis MX1]|eukprot:XP_001748742.1 hypothetical protein [Monosiga brevicollis MX1]